MPGLDMLDVVIGVIFMYLLVSLICSAAVEFLEALLRFRARDLEHGIRELLQNNPDLVKEIYDHPLVNSLYAGQYGEAGKVIYSRWEKFAMRKRHLPSYIPARNFALALLDSIGGSAAVTGTVPPPPTVPPAAAALPTPAQISLGAVQDTNAYKAVATLVAAARNDAAKARENIEDWFNTGMDRVCGWYKRRTQYFLLAAGLAAAVAFNLDSIGVAKALAANKTLRDGIVSEAIKAAKEPPPEAATTTAPASTTDTAQPTASVADNAASTSIGNTVTTATPGTSATTGTPATTATSVSETNTATGTTTNTPPSTTTDVVALATQKATALQQQVAVLNASGLPVGWHNPFLPTPAGWGIVTKILGLLITACAVSFGAPFWFDMLNKVIMVRSVMKPKQKSAADEKTGSKA